MALIVTASLAGCNGNGVETSDNNTPTTAQTDNNSSNEGSSQVKADLSNPSVVVESGDFDAIEKLGKDMQNFAVEENKVLE